MKINWKQIGISFLFCLILIMSFNVFVFAEDVEILLPDNSFSSVTKTFKDFYLESMVKGADNAYTDVKEEGFVPTYTMEWKQQEIITLMWVEDEDGDGDGVWVEADSTVTEDTETKQGLKTIDCTKNGLISDFDTVDFQDEIDGIVSSHYIDIYFTFQEKSYKVSFFPLEGIFDESMNPDAYNSYVQKLNSSVFNDNANVEESKENLKKLSEGIKKV